MKAQIAPSVHLDHIQMFWQVLLVLLVRSRTCRTMVLYTVILAQQILSRFNKEQLLLMHANVLQVPTINYLRLILKITMVTMEKPARVVPQVQNVQAKILCQLPYQVIGVKVCKRHV